MKESRKECDIVTCSPRQHYSVMEGYPRRKGTRKQDTRTGKSALSTFEIFGAWCKKSKLEVKPWDPSKSTGTTQECRECTWPETLVACTHIEVEMIAKTAQHFLEEHLRNSCTILKVQDLAVSAAIQSLADIC